MKKILLFIILINPLFLFAASLSANLVESLSEADQKKLDADGFVITELQVKQCFSVYASPEMPVFITVDSLLNGYHILYEDSVIRMEKMMRFRLADLLKGLLNNLDRAAAFFEGNHELVDESYWRARITLSVALNLIDPSFEVKNKKIKSIVQIEIDRIKEARWTGKPEWLGKVDEGFLAVDYSRFKPRSFYAEDVRLQGYFQAVSWLQAIPFRYEKKSELISFLMISKAYQIALKSSSIDLSIFYNNYNSFLGQADNPGVEQLLPLFDGHKTLNVDDEFFTEIQKKNSAYIKSSDLPKINDVLSYSPDGSNVEKLNFRIVPELRVPESLLFQQTTDRRRFSRALPDSYEIPAVLGSGYALDKVTKGQSDKLEELLKKSGDLFNGNSLYQEYYQVLKTLLCSKDKRKPRFMQQPAWEEKNCNTVLAGFTQLRHTWALHAKRCEYYECFVDSFNGFVEPEPDFYREFAALVERTIGLLEQTGVFFLNTTSKSNWNTLYKMAVTLEKLAEKQLNDISFSKDDNLFIEKYGETLAAVMFYEGDSYLDERDDIPKIVDFFHNSELGTHLHAAVGRPVKIYVLYPWNGQQILCEGAVLPYFEVAAETRLTDEEWRLGKIDE